MAWPGISVTGAFPGSPIAALKIAHARGVMLASSLLLLTSSGGAASPERRTPKGGLNALDRARPKRPSVTLLAWLCSLCRQALHGRGSCQAPPDDVNDIWLSKSGAFYALCPGASLPGLALPCLALPGPASRNFAYPLRPSRLFLPTRRIVWCLKPAQIRSCSARRRQAFRQLRPAYWGGS